MQDSFKKPIFTYILIVLNVAMFGVEFLTDAIGNTQGLIALGAKEVLLITQGEWWRLITPMFLHANLRHLVSNMFALYMWGRYAEAMMGRGRYVFAYLMSGIAGSILGYAMSVNVSVGASGAIFGIFGLFLYLRIWNKQIFDNLFGKQVIVMILINLGFSLYSPNIDFYGHIGGMIGGFLTAMAVGMFGQHSAVKFRVLGIAGYILLFGGLFLWGYLKYSAYLL